MEQWEPWNGEVLPLEREPEDNCAVGIKKNGETVGHIPFNQAPVVFAFIFEKVIKQASDLLRSLEPK